MYARVKEAKPTKQGYASEGNAMLNETLRLIVPSSKSVIKNHEERCPSGWKRKMEMAWIGLERARAPTKQGNREVYCCCCDLALWMDDLGLLVLPGEEVLWEVAPLFRVSALGPAASGAR